MHDFPITRNVSTLLTPYYSISAKSNDNFNIHDTFEINTLEKSTEKLYLSFFTVVKVTNI